MIYSSLKGGLGNMMFEIAAMVSLAHDNNDTCGFVNIEPQIAYLNNETNFNPNMKHAQEYMYLLQQFKCDLPLSYPQQFSVPYHYVPLQYVKGAFYDGFFQSEKWFKHNRSKVLNVLKQSSEQHQLMLNKYQQVLQLQNRVAIHVRRGDYVTNQQNHNLLGLDYFNAALSHFPNCNYVFFSDDIEWCKQNFTMPNTYFVSDKDYVEIYLMAEMDHFIISNSSFGWWGAWMSCNESKQVIGPKKWFGPNIQHNTNDVLPETWIKL